jgi:hypothetical protein
MVVVKDFADSAAGALGDFAGAFGRADADILSGNHRTLANIAGGVDRMKCDKVTRTFANPFGRSSCTLGSSLSDVTGTLACLGTWTALMRLLFGGWLR